MAAVFLEKAMIPRECSACTVSPHGARIYCPECEDALYEQPVYECGLSDSERFDFPMSAVWRGIPQSTPVRHSDQGYQEPDPNLPDATVAYLEGRLDQVEGQAKYLQAKLQEHLNRTNKYRKDKL